MKKFSHIKEESFKNAVNEEYQRAKHILNPLLKGVNRSFVKIVWGKNLKSRGGVCWKKDKYIEMNPKYLYVNEGKWSFDNFRMTLRHEICHLVARGHGARFLHYLELLGGHRYVGSPMYEGRKPKNK